jgi:hypothetical protein
MNGSSVIDGCGLDGIALVKLTTAIEHSFDVQELDELVLLTFSEGLFNTFVRNDLSGHYTILELLRALDRRGTIPLFLQAVRKARPLKNELIQVISECCPGAMSDAAPESEGVEAVETVSKGMTTLHQMRAGTAIATRVNDRVVESRTKLQLLAQGLDELRAYKLLHDALQKVQQEQYKEFAAYVGKLRPDPRIESILRPLISRLIMTFEDAQQGLEGLCGNKRKYAREKKWLDEFQLAIKAAGVAVDETNDTQARYATITIRKIIRMEPAHLNDELRNSAETLPLENLISTISEVALIPELSDQQAAELSSTNTKLETLWIGLRGRVAIHDQWQEVETELWGADDESDKTSPEAEDFKLCWLKIKQRLKPLWNLDPLANWVIKTQEFADKIDASVSAIPIDLNNALLNYGRFRFHARNRFYAVDTDLKGFCEKILRLSQPLTNLLS